jgi:hypothetical protein
MFNFRDKNGEKSQKDTLGQVGEKGDKNRGGREQKKPKGGTPKREPRPEVERWTDPVSEAAVKKQLLQIQLRPTSSNVFDTGFPIDDVIESISEVTPNNKFGGFASYWKLARAAKDGTLPIEDTTDFENLKNACAEALVFKYLRETPGAGVAPITTNVIFDPIGKASALKDLLSDTFKPLANKIIASTKGKTPDILLVSKPFTYREENATITNTFGWKNVIDPSDSTASKVKTRSYDNVTVVSPVEVTTSQNFSNMKDKLSKFRKYANVFRSLNGIEFAPVAVYDRNAFLALELGERLEIVQGMAAIGGNVQLVPGLIDLSKNAARNISTELVQAVAAAQRTKSKELEPKDNKGQKSLFSRLFEKAKEQLKDFKQSFALKNKPEKLTNAAPQKRLASEIYQEMIDSLKDTASYPEKAGIDIFNNSEHLDLMLAMQLAKKDAAYEIVLKQSPNYRSKEPAAAKAWFEKMLEDGRILSKEYYFDSDGSQEIIRSYDNDASRPLEKSNFEKLSESVQRYNSSYSTDREGLLVAVATAAIKAGMNPEQVLRQDPKYSANEKGEALVEKTIENAESNIQAERSRVEQQALRDSQRGRDSGYER